jgi:hypothetical protein
LGIIYVLYRERNMKGKKMKTKTLIGLMISLILLTSCVTATPTEAYPPPGSGLSTPTIAVPYPGPTELPPATQTPPGPTPAQTAAIQEVSKKYNIPADQIQIVSTEPVTWPTGCLGVVIPGVMCTDVVTPGFRIILSANSQQFEMHTNQDGTSVIDAAQQLATLGFVVKTTDGTIQIVSPSIPLGPTYNPAFNGLLPTGGAILGTAYVLDFTTPAKVVAINSNGSQDLSFIQDPTYGLAIWRGSLGTSPLLAWGTQLTSSSNSSSLMIAAPDGTQLETLLTIAAGNSPGSVQLVAEFWSADGQSLYFSKEPVGLGGYIPFSGASNLYQINIATKEVTEIIPLGSSTEPQACLDAISGDYRYVADHCTQNVITIRDLQTGTSTTIQAPADVTSYRLMGSARFSPAGDRVAFALAQGNPDNEQGWVAVADRTGSTSTMILAGEAGSYYTVLGWLDDQTLLVQSNTFGSSNAGNQLFTVGADGSNLTKVADGSFLTIIDNR